MGGVSWKHYSAAAILVITISILGYGVGQSDFRPLIISYSVAFAVYLWVYAQVKTDTEIYFYIGLAVLLRGVLVPGFPNLSDDIYRFLWDGYLIINGYNPFDALPSELIGTAPDIPGISQALFEELNSPDYYTIYPPIAQFVNVVAVGLFPNSWWGSAVIMKLFLFAFEVGNLWLLLRLLSRFHLPLKNALIYGLNPLIIVEVLGNLHFEGGMIFFFLLGFYLLTLNRLDWAALAMAGAVAAKLLPMLFMPFLIKRLGWWKSVRFFAIMGLAILLMFLPLLSGAFINNFGSSLDLYFRRFEFNGSLYYLFRWIGYQTDGYNLIKIIGPRLAIGVLIGVAVVALTEKVDQDAPWKSFPGVALFAITLYLFLGTTIHPWYVSLPLVLCCFTPFRYPTLWSGVIMLTYVNYSYPTYFENLWIVLLEYLLVYGLLIGEWFFKMRRSSRFETPRRTD